MTLNQKRLKQVDEAITAILVTGQEYTHEGRRVRRADLPDLQKLRMQILDEIAQASDTNAGTSVAVFEGR